LFVFGLVSAGPADAGQLTWTPGSAPPSLVIALGDGSVKRTLELPSGALQLDLTLKSFLVDSTSVVEVWKNDGQPWVREAKKIPGESTTERVDLPPGRLITLEITTAGGTSLVLIKLRRN